MQCHSYLQVKQLHLERSVAQTAANDYRELYNDLLEMGLGGQLSATQKVLQADSILQIVVGWFGLVSDAIEAHRKELKGKRGLAQQLSLVNSDQLAVIAIHTILCRRLC